MSWTVLGSTGYIGSRLRLYLERTGESVFAPFKGDPGIFEKDLGNVVYCIGVTADFRERPYDTIDAHVTYLSEILRRAEFKSFLYLSSTRVYIHCNNTRETSPVIVQVLEPGDLYNLSKLLGEALCLQDSRDCIRVARISNVVGGDMAKANTFLSSIIQAAGQGNVRLNSSLASAKDYIHIDDVVSLLVKITQTGFNRLYNVASGQQITHEQWVNALIRRYDCLVEVERNADIVVNEPIDSTMIRTEFSYNPTPIDPFQYLSSTNFY
jgi:nucleoside-diphosphate-sugar epimerase